MSPAGGRSPADGAAQRVLVLRCADWPEPSGGAGESAGGGESAGAWEGGPEARAFEQVVTVVEEFCPRVEVLRPGACAVGARGPARYFGGEAALARKLVEAVTGAGFACQAGVADGLFAAQLAARISQAPPASPARPPASPDPPSASAGSPVPAAPAGSPFAAAGPGFVVVAPGRTPAFLAPYPVAVLGHPELADLLPRLGIETLGEYAALSPAEAANRFGTSGTLAHRLARGLEPRPLVPRPPAADLSVGVEFDPPAEQAEPVVFAAKTLAEQLHEALAARGLACVRVQVQVACEDGQEITRLWRHDGLLSSLAVAERVRWQLAGWRTAQDAAQDVRGRDAREGVADGQDAHGEDARDRDSPRSGTPRPAADEGIQAGGITHLRLVPDQLVRNTGRQLGLWGDTVVSDRVARAALRVQAMLGHSAVARPLLAGGRDPAQQVTLVPFGDAADPLFPAGRPWPARLPPPSPATVYPVPLPAQVIDASGTPVTVTGRALISAPPVRLSARGEPWLAITSWAGPWPVTERWWHQPAGRRRARFQLVAEDGRAWLAVVQDGQWLLEATYE
jgi:protein ImuB